MLNGIWKIFIIFWSIDFSIWKHYDFQISQIKSEIIFKLHMMWNNKNRKFYSPNFALALGINTGSKSMRKKYMYSSFILYSTVQYCSTQVCGRYYSLMIGNDSAFFFRSRQQLEDFIFLFYLQRSFHSHIHKCWFIPLHLTSAWVKPNGVTFHLRFIRICRKYFLFTSEQTKTKQTNRWKFFCHYQNQNGKIVKGLLGGICPRIRQYLCKYITMSLWH